MSDQLSTELSSLRIDRSDSSGAGKGRGGVRALVVLAVLGALGGIGAAAWPHLEAQLFKTEVDVTQISSVSPAQSATTITATGFVVARRLSKVAAKTAGRVLRVHVVEGQTVRAGDLLIELDAIDQQSAIASARARVAAANARAVAARANLTEIEQQLSRSRALVESGAAARSQVEDLSARAQSLGEAVRVAQAEMHALALEVRALEISKTQLAILAPIDGTVITKPVEIGEMVSPVSEVLQLADFSSLVVEVDVPENRLAQALIGSPCEIVLDAFPTTRFRGETSEIGRRVNRAKASVPVRVRFSDAAENVLPDMAARVSFLREALTPEQLRAAERTVVPASAIVSRGGRTIVFEIASGVVHERPVTLGEDLGGMRVMTDGPAIGTKIVSNPPETLRDGVSVKERAAR